MVVVSEHPVFFFGCTFLDVLLSGSYQVPIRADAVQTEGQHCVYMRTPRLSPY